MSSKRDRALDGIIAMLESHNIGLDELRRRMDEAETDGGVVLRSFVHQEAKKLSHDTRRTYLTSIRRLMDGSPHFCECDCVECCDLSAGCACECRKCETSKLQVASLSDGAIASMLLTRVALSAQSETATNLNERGTPIPDCNPRRISAGGVGSLQRNDDRLEIGLAPVSGRAAKRGPKHLVLLRVNPPKTA